MMIQKMMTSEMSKSLVKSDTLLGDVLNILAFTSPYRPQIEPEEKGVMEKVDLPKTYFPRIPQGVDPEAFYELVEQWSSEFVTYALTFLDLDNEDLEDKLMELTLDSVAPEGDMIKFGESDWALVYRQQEEIMRVLVHHSCPKIYWKLLREIRKLESIRQSEVNDGNTEM